MVFFFALLLLLVLLFSLSFAFVSLLCTAYCFALRIYAPWFGTSGSIGSRFRFRLGRGSIITYSSSLICSDGFALVVYFALIGWVCLVHLGFMMDE